MAETEEQDQALPGSEFFARRIERRRLLRWAANGLFLRVAVGSAAGYRFFFMNPESAKAIGGCCAYSCCGPSPCCGTSCCSKNCCSPTNPSQCLNCSPDYGEYASSGCWTCFYSTYYVACCDCKASGCGQYNRCICEKAVHRPALDQSLIGKRTESSPDGVPIEGAPVINAPV